MPEGHDQAQTETSPHDALVRLDGQVALITGGGSGIGYAIAQWLHHCGATVALIGRRKERVDAAAAELGERALGFAFDVTQLDQVNDLVREVGDTLGSPDILINNAGLHLKRSAIETTDREFREVMETHVDAGFALARALAPAMMERGRGSILFVASMASLFGIPNVAAYSAAKTAQVGLVRSLTAEFAHAGVRVNAIAPGWIETEMSKAALSQDAARYNRIIERTPMRRMGTPDEVGRVAAFLCSDAAAFVTGAVLPVDGGASIGF